MSDAAEIPLTEKRVYYLKTSGNSSTIYTSIRGIMDPIKTLIDSGSSRDFIHISFARQHSLPLVELQHTQSIIAIDGNTLPKQIRFKTIIEIDVEGRTFKQRFYALPLGDTPVILGLTWLTNINPDIDRKTGDIKYQDEPIYAKGANAEIDLPPKLSDFKDIFSEELFKQIPDHREFDCSIDFKPDAIIPKAAPIYPMSPAESTSRREYLDKEIADGKIRPSKSPTAAPCFFVKKKDGSLRLVVDY